MTADFSLLEPANGDQRIESWQDHETIRCPFRAGHARAGRPYGLVSAKPSNVVAGLDVVWTWSSEILISTRAAKHLRVAGITGFHTEPLAPWKTTGRTLEGFERFVVTGWGGNADSTRGVEVVDRCDACGHVSFIARSANVIDPAAWNGEDAFFVWPFPKFIFVTERFRDLVDAAGLTGCAFAPAQVDPETRYTPGKLEYYLPPDRIAALRLV
jgi:hypothetical protein